MPLQSSGTISLEDIRAEFNGGYPIGLGSYYRGGSRVPNDPFCHNNQIPASGQIGMGQFYTTTDGEHWFYVSSTNSNYALPANARRFQLNIGGAGGGGVAVGDPIFGGFRNAAAGGGGGAKTTNTRDDTYWINCNTNTTLNIVIGAAGTNQSRTAYTSNWEAGAGGWTTVGLANPARPLDGPQAGTDFTFLAFLGNGGLGGYVGTDGVAEGGFGGFWKFPGEQGGRQSAANNVARTGNGGAPTLGPDIPPETTRGAGATARVTAAGVRSFTNAQPGYCWIRC